MQRELISIAMHTVRFSSFLYALARGENFVGRNLDEEEEDMRDPNLDYFSNRYTHRVIQ
jgi:hypothetical protein